MSWDSGGYRFIECPFCGSEIRHVESLARSFDPPRVYHEWHHIDDDETCFIRKRGKMVASATDDGKQQESVIRSWNKRTT